ncbi:hypothetical protein DAMA08_033600 [Martiniozyma asiatica (nom. inval.)]|nr:hypothetical protein DAMA08_033600 [Martiniozyma asiatica]
MAEPYSQGINVSATSLKTKRKSLLNSKRRSVSGSAAQNKEQNPKGGIRRLSLQFSSSVSSFISFNHTNNSTESQFSIVSAAPRFSLYQQYQNCARWELDNVQLYTPQFPKDCCDYILKNNIVEGIFRMNGSLRNVSAMERKMDNEFNWQFNETNMKKDLDEDYVPSAYDTASLLKRWISRIEGGLITKPVAHRIRLLLEETRLVTPIATPATMKQAFFDTPVQQEPNLKDTEGTPTGDDTFLILETNSEDSAQNCEQDVKPLPSQYSLYVEELSQLPIQNLHILLFLLNFFNKLSQEKNVAITRMDSKNLAKVLQLSFFNTDDHVAQPNIYGSMESFSELTNLYDSFERVLTNWIKRFDELFNDLKPVLVANEYKMTDFLSMRERNQIENKNPIPLAKSNSNLSNFSVISENETKESEKAAVAIVVTDPFTDIKPTNINILHRSFSNSSNDSVLHTPHDLKKPELKANNKVETQSSMTEKQIPNVEKGKGKENNIKTSKIKDKTDEKVIKHKNSVASLNKLSKSLEANRDDHKQLPEKQKLPINVANSEKSSFSKRFSFMFKKKPAEEQSTQQSESIKHDQNKVKIKGNKRSSRFF